MERKGWLNCFFVLMLTAALICLLLYAYAHSKREIQFIDTDTELSAETIIDPTIWHDKNVIPTGYRLVGFVIKGTEKIVESMDQVRLDNVFNPVYEYERSELPVLAVSLENQEEKIEKDQYSQATAISIASNRRYPESMLRCGIKGRGQSSWSCEKNPTD